MEAIVKYLKEEIDLSYKEIAFLLNRNYDPIAITYRNSRKKHRQGFKNIDSEKIPLSIFSNLKLSILENLVKYLKEELSLSNHEIAIILNRDDRTIWTVYDRSKKK